MDLNMDEKTVTLKDFTNSEFDFLAEMIHEKLSDMGFNTNGNFSFDLKVSYIEEPEFIGKNCKIFVDDIHKFTVDESEVEATIKWLHKSGFNKIFCERISSD